VSRRVRRQGRGYQQAIETAPADADMMKSMAHKRGGAMGNASMLGLPAAACRSQRRNSSPHAKANGTEACRIAAAIATTWACLAKTRERNREAPKLPGLGGC